LGSRSAERGERYVKDGEFLLVTDFGVVGGRRGARAGVAPGDLPSGQVGGQVAPRRNSSWCSGLRL